VNYTFRALPTRRCSKAGSPRPLRLPLQLQSSAAHHALQAAARLRRRLAQFIAALEPVRRPASSACCSSSFHPTSRPMPDRLRRLSRSSRAAEQTGHCPSPSSSATSLVHRRDLRDPPRAQRRALHRRKRRPRHARGHHRRDYTCYRLRRNGGYTPAELEPSPSASHAARKERDVYVYFKHEDEPTGALNAAAFSRRAASGR
jgi:hypothetical protein